MQQDVFDAKSELRQLVPTAIGVLRRIMSSDEMPPKQRLDAAVYVIASQLTEVAESDKLLVEVRKFASQVGVK